MVVTQDQVAEDRIIGTGRVGLLSAIILSPSQSQVVACGSHPWPRWSPMAPYMTKKSSCEREVDKLELFNKLDSEN